MRAKLTLILSIAVLLLLAFGASSSRAAIDYSQGEPLLTSGNSAILSPLPLTPQEDSIYYDSDPGSFIPSYSDSGSMFAVRFTPAQTCSLMYIKVVTAQGAGDAKIHIWADNSGEPGDDLTEAFVATLDGNQDYQVINLNTPVNIGSDDFFIGVEYLQDAPPHITTDNQANVDGRSVIKHPDDDWGTANHNLNIRAFVHYYEQPSEECYIYDNGPAAWLPQYGNAGDMFAVRFTNTHYPAEICSLKTVQVATKDGSGDVSLHIWSSINGTPGDDITTPFTVTFNGDMEFQDITIDPPIVINQQDFFVGWELLNDAPPYGVTDNDGNTQNRSKVKHADGDWAPTGNDLTFRACVTYATEQPEELVYDSGTAVNWLPNDDEAGTQFSTRFTRTYSHYPDTCAVLQSIAVMTKGASASDAMVYIWDTDCTGSPDTTVLTSFQTTFNNDMNWQQIDLPEPLSLYCHDFHVGWELIDGAPPYALLDGDGNTESRSKVLIPGDSSWTTLGNDLMVRAYVTYRNDDCDCCPPVGVNDGDIADVPSAFGLTQNYPNPFNAATVITYTIDQPSKVTLKIYNIAGQLVETLINNQKSEVGVQSIQWDASNHPSGIYFYKLSAGEKSVVKRMTLLK